MQFFVEPNRIICKQKDRVRLGSKCLNLASQAKTLLNAQSFAPLAKVLLKPLSNQIHISFQPLQL